jgi:hypothetical protein
MEILYCGTESQGNFITDISKKDTIKYSGRVSRIADYESFIFEKQYDVIIVDISNLIDEPETVVDYLNRVKAAKNCKIIIRAAGFNYKSVVIAALIKKNFVNFVLALGLATQQEEYQKCINNYFEENGLPVIEQEEETKSDPTITSFRTIGVCGTMDRIGTTTQCMQLVKYFIYKGYTAAYIEVSNNNYIELCKALYADAKVNKEKNCTTFNSVDMYASNDTAFALAAKYDYLIFDYGNLLQPGFNKISFIEKDIKIFVAGSKPNEFDKIQPVLESITYKDAYYIFNFVPEGDKKDLLEMMCERAEKTMFSGYCPDPFDYIRSADNFDKIINITDVTEPQSTKKGLLTKIRKKVG